MPQTLQTNIVINAVSNGFGEIGNTLSVLGAQIDEISQHLINFGKESINVYKDYEKNMAEARVALATIYGRDTKELNDVMKGLDAAATQWASSTIFHTDDVSNAITEAARAGWDYNQILTGIPVAMELAQAGSIDLSDALNYITQTAKAGGFAFEDLSDLVDMWAFAANSSNGTVKSFGDALLKLGSTMRFTDSKEELFSLIALMHDMGETGTSAATLLRNSMIRLLAPSGVAGGIMEELGATQEEIDEVRQDASKLAAFDTLKSAGFDPFDANKQAKPILEIYSELGEVLAGIAGGYDNIVKNETTLGVLSNIFGVRSMTGALDIVSALEKAKALYEQLQSGEAAGYGEYAANTIMDTLYGSMETWESKVEKLKQKTGEALAPQLEDVHEILGGIVDSLSSLDTGTFNALVAGLEVIAAAGPGLILAGGAFRALAYAMTPAGGIGLGLIALTAAAAAIHELEEADYASMFGDMELDASGIQNYVQKLSEDFKSAYTEVEGFKTALDQAVTSYTEATSTFKSSLIQDMLTGVELKEGSTEYEKLSGLGEQIISAINDSIANNYAIATKSVTELLGGEDVAPENPLWQQVMDALLVGYDDAISQAETLSNDLREAMTSAFADGKLSSAEIDNFQSIFDEMNRLMALQAEADEYVKQQSILRRGQSLGLESTEALLDEMQQSINDDLEYIRQMNDRTYINTKQGLDRQVERGEITPEQADETLKGLKEAQNLQEKTATGTKETLILDTAEALISDSSLEGAWRALQSLGDSYRQNGGIVTQEALGNYGAEVTPKESMQTQQFLNTVMQRLGEYEAIKEYADYFATQGEEDLARRYQQILDMYDAMGGRGEQQPMPEVGRQQAGDFEGYAGSYDNILQLLQGSYGGGLIGGGSGLTPESLAGYVQQMRELGAEPDWFSYLGSDLWSKFNAAAQEGGFGSITDMIEAAVPGDAEMKVTPVMDEESLDTNLDPIPVDIQPRMDDSDPMQQLQDQGVQVDVEGDTASLEATIDGADGQTLMEYVDGDASNLEMKITSQDGKTLLEHVHGDASHLASVISKYDGKTITVHIHGVKDFASGGRATEASIFGEAGPEWAIPEKHTQRTAELLDAARAASGFTWPELLARNGGMNANPNNTPTTLVYSPTIYAQNAEGVEEKLIADKARLEKWFANKQMMDRMEVYS